jgi:hypothetical protein
LKQTKMSKQQLSKKSSDQAVKLKGVTRMSPPHKKTK